MDRHSQLGDAGASAAQEGSWGPPRTRLITWFDPAAAAREGRDLSGREFLARIIDGRLPPPPIAQVLGARLISAGDGEAVFHCVPDESSYNPMGMVHGGWLCTLLDSAAGCAVRSLLPPGVGVSSIEIKVTFLRPLRAGSELVEARASVLRLGRRVAFAEAHARVGNELIGHATTSVALLTENGAR